MVKEKIISIVFLIVILSCDGGEMQNITGSMDCMGDPIPIDCSDNSVTGCAYLNSCGVCLGGSSTNEDLPCPCPDNFIVSIQTTPTETVCYPELFEHAITTVQAGYLFHTVIIGDNSIASSNCNDVDDCDWVGAFNGDVCVGAIQWNTDTCGSEVCSINVMGNDYGEHTPSGYMNSGEFPEFKIYDVSDNIYYSAIPSQEYPWYSTQVYSISELSAQP